MPRTPRAVRRYHAQALVSRLLVKPDTWLTFFVAAWLICLSPGPGVLSSVTAGMRWGFRISLSMLSSSISNEKVLSARRGKVVERHMS